MSEVVRTLKIITRFPLQSRNWKTNEKCPICGKPILVDIISIYQEEDGSIWVEYERYCSDEQCTYDQIVNTQIYPVLEEHVVG